MVTVNLVEQRQYFRIKETCSFFEEKNFTVISHFNIKLSCVHSSSIFFVWNPNKRNPSSGSFPISIQQYQILKRIYEADLGHSPQNLLGVSFLKGQETQSTSIAGAQCCPDNPWGEGVSGKGSLDARVFSPVSLKVQELMLFSLLRKQPLLQGNGMFSELGLTRVRLRRWDLCLYSQQLDKLFILKVFLVH